MPTPNETQATEERTMTTTTTTDGLIALFDLIALRLTGILAANAFAASEFFARADSIGMNGFSHAELSAAFDRVKNSRDWKAPIVGACKPDDYEITRCAILFFTATVPIFDAILNHDRSEVVGYHVEADGYRMGPAGDH